MRKRDNLEGPKVAELLRRWENASLSEEEEQELDAALLTAGAANMTDEEYAPLAEDADAFISALAMDETSRNRHKIRRYVISGAVAAACAAIAVVTVWLNFYTTETDGKARMATVVPVDTLHEKNRSQYALQQPSVQDVSDVKENIASTDEKTMVANGVKTSKKRTLRGVKTASGQLTEEEESAWRMFMATCAEMEEVVKPDMVGAIWNDVPVMTGYNPDSQDINIKVNLYESLETAGEMLNSIYEGL